MNEPNDSVGLPVIKQGDQYGVILPCKPDQFQQFISGLLGKPQELRGEAIGLFELRPHDIANTFHLVDQRIRQQNGGTIIQFTIAVHYNDGASVTHHNVQDFTTYHPVHDCYPVEIVMQFIYLIQFAGRSAPEKQEIEIGMMCGSNESRRRNRYYGKGCIDWVIRHTERTWASDVSNLLKGSFEKSVTKQPWIISYVYRYSDELLELIFGLTLITSLWFWYVEFANRLLLLTPELSADLNLYLGRSVVLFLSLWITLRVLIKFCEYRTLDTSQSYILLVDADEKRMTRTKNSMWKSTGWTLFIWFSGVVSGVASNYLYALL